MSWAGCGSAFVAALSAAAASSCSRGAARAAAPTGPYVSLGDSYTSAPLVPIPTGNPIGCGRSTSNYPSDVTRVIHPSSFTDVSCGSATTDNMTQPQSVPFGGTNAPQFNALSAADTLVTVGIGGNDAGLVGVAEECATLDSYQPFGTACKNHYNSLGFGHQRGPDQRHRAEGRGRAPGDPRTGAWSPRADRRLSRTACP